MQATDSISTLDADEAKRLVKAAGDTLSLNGLTSLDLPTAEVLALYRGNLYLDGLTALPEEVARALALHEWGCLRLNGLRSVTTGVADALARHRRHLLLNGLEAITDEVAESLGRRRCALSLDGVKTLTVRAARGLAQPMGWPKRLDGQETRPDDVEKTLGQIPGKPLSFASLWRTTEELEEGLAAHSGDLLLPSLEGLQSYALARKWMADEVTLGKIRHLTLEAALGLGPSKIRREDVVTKTLSNEQIDLHYGDDGDSTDVYLDDLTTLPADVATALAVTVTGVLGLDGLESLPDDVAAALSHFEGYRLQLNNVTSLSTVACQCLATLGCELWLHSISYLGQHESKLLAGKEGFLSLPGLEVLLDEDLASKLIEDDGSEHYCQPSLRVITDEVAEILVSAKGSLGIGNLVILTPHIAKAFAGFYGSIELPLDDLVELTDECAELLSHYAGAEMRLGRPHKISEHAESLLRANSSIVLDTPEEKETRLRWSGR